MTTSFNATMDKIGYYVEQADAGAGTLGILLLQVAEPDTTLADHDTVAALLTSVGNDEATFSNYVRKTLATPTRTVDDAADRVLLGGADPGTAVQVQWDLAGGVTNNTLVKALFFYDPTGSADDTVRLPLMATDIAASTDGNDLVLTLHTDGFARVTRAA